MANLITTITITDDGRVTVASPDGDTAYRLVDEPIADTPRVPAAVHASDFAARLRQTIAGYMDYNGNRIEDEGGNKMREKVKETLLNALEKELAVEGEEIRPYFVETLVDCISRLDEEEAPQVQTEEQGSVVIKTKDSITSKVGKSIIKTTADGFIVRFLE